MAVSLSWLRSPRVPRRVVAYGARKRSVVKTECHRPTKASCRRRCPRHLAKPEQRERSLWWHRPASLVSERLLRAVLRWAHLQQHLARLALQGRPRFARLEAHSARLVAQLPVPQTRLARMGARPHCTVAVGAVLAEGLWAASGLFEAAFPILAYFRCCQGLERVFQFAKPEDW